MKSLADCFQMILGVESEREKVIQTARDQYQARGGTAEVTDIGFKIDDGHLYANLLAGNQIVAQCEVQVTRADDGRRGWQLHWEA